MYLKEISVTWCEPFIKETFMTLSLVKNQLNPGLGTYYGEAWHLVLESHLPNFLQSPNNRLVPIAAVDAFRFEGDLFSLLGQSAYYTDPTDRWLVMRLNGMRSPMEYTASMTQLIFPSTAEIGSLFDLYRTVSRKIT